MRCFNCEECRNHQFSQMLVCFIFQKSLEESSCFMKTANCEHFLQLQEKSLNLGNTYLLNNYGKSIIRIETKSIKIATVKDYGRPSWRFGKVIYNLAKQKKIIHKFLKLYFDIEEKQNEDISDDDYEQLELMQYELINHLCVALDLFKEESKYSKEEETRFVFDFEGRTDNTIHENNGKKYIILENIASFAQFHKTIT